MPESSQADESLRSAKARSRSAHPRATESTNARRSQIRKHLRWPSGCVSSPFPVDPEAVNPKRKRDLPPRRRRLCDLLNCAGRPYAEVAPWVPHVERQQELFGRAARQLCQANALALDVRIWCSEGEPPPGVVRALTSRIPRRRCRPDRRTPLTVVHLASGTMLVPGLRQNQVGTRVWRALTDKNRFLRIAAICWSGRTGASGSFRSAGALSSLDPQVMIMHSCTYCVSKVARQPRS